MKTTDEMILDLVAAGFVLPKDVCRHYDPTDKADCFALQMRHANGGRQCWVLISDQQAHDLCACEFARQVDHDGPMHGAVARTEFNYHMSRGDSAAAIQALWEGV